MDKVIDAHKAEYETAPSVIAVAPGRFHLIGEHTWFFKDKTLSMAVNLPVYVAVSARKDSNLRFSFVQLKEKKRSSLSSLKYKKEDKWANALKAVIFGFQSLGFDCGGMNFTIYSDIQPSAGFGITTAIKVASAWAATRTRLRGSRSTTAVGGAMRSAGSFARKDADWTALRSPSMTAGPYANRTFRSRRRWRPAGGTIRP